VTPHPENNTVVARGFRLPGTRRRFGGSRGRAVVVLPQWNSDADGHIGLSRLLARFGISALRLSLPYHDARMPPELTRADYIVSANVVRTIQVCRQAVLDARRAVAWLAGQGYERIGILGTSLGSCLALLTAAHEPRIRAQALNHVSPWFAGCRVAGTVDAARAPGPGRQHRSRPAARPVASDQSVVVPGPSPSHGDAAGLRAL
jgi:dienelactone hydrolase